MDIIAIVFAVILAMFLPGFTLMMALFPSRNELDVRDDMMYRIFLATLLSIVISGSILVLMALLPGEPFTKWNIIFALSVPTIIFFIWGYYRGAYPFLGREAPAVATPSLSKEGMALEDEIKAKIKLVNRRLITLRRKYENDPTRGLGTRIRKLEVQLEFLKNTQALLGKPDEVQEMYDRAQALVRKWGRLSKLEARADGDRRIKLGRKRVEVEEEIRYLHQMIQIESERQRT